MGIALTLLYVVACIFLILVVLLQTGKRADLAGAFGGGGSQTALGTRGVATLLSKATTIAAVLFMLLALSLSILSQTQSGRSGSVLDEVADDAAAPPPVELPAGSVPELPPLPGESSIEESPIDDRGRRRLRHRRFGHGRVEPVAVDPPGRVGYNSRTQCRSGGTGRHTILRGWRP